MYQTILSEIRKSINVDLGNDVWKIIYDMLNVKHPNAVIMNDKLKELLELERIHRWVNDYTNNLNFDDDDESIRPDNCYLLFTGNSCDKHNYYYEWNHQKLYEDKSDNEAERLYTAQMDDAEEQYLSNFEEYL